LEKQNLKRKLDAILERRDAALPARKKNERVHFGRLSWDLLDYEGPRKYPKGKWSKGHHGSSSSTINSATGKTGSPSSPSSLQGVVHVSNCTAGSRSHGGLAWLANPTVAWLMVAACHSIATRPRE